MTEQGSPSVMSLNTVDIEYPSAGDVQIKQSVIGFNYMDIYQRSGLYPLDLPSGLGLEAAGTIHAIGENVDEFNVGDRVAYATAPQGAYAEYRNFPANRVVHLPNDISDEQCAATLFKGMTVEYLLNRCYNIEKDEKVLFLGSGGGVGTLAGQWGNSKGAYMVGVDGGEEKCELARRSGYSEVIDFTKENVVERVKEITEGVGMPVVYDPIGGPTYEQTLDCLGPRGYFISFGTTGGPMPPVDPPILQKRDSLYFTRPTVATYTAKRQDLVTSANSVFNMISSDNVKVEIGQRYGLDDAVLAHEDTEAGRTRGSSILIA
jgi:NADPH2:quinone reductase